jgi:hypothetical protein
MYVYVYVYIYRPLASCHPGRGAQGTARVGLREEQRLEVMSVEESEQKRKVQARMKQREEVRVQ